MMARMDTRELHTAIIELWDADQDLADDLDAKLETIRKWRQRRIPSDWWPELIDKSAARGWPLTLGMFRGAEPLPERPDRKDRKAA